jgi:hypothetical protein
MIASAQYGLIIKAADVARSAQGWSVFLKALKEYTDEKVAQCIAAPSEMLQVAQGRAQACRDLYVILETCTNRADEIAAKRGV